MYRDIKRVNDLCFKKDLELKYKSYKQHSSNMKPMIDNSQPHNYKRSDAKTKMLQLEKHRTIYVENSNLVSRLA